MLLTLQSGGQLFTGNACTMALGVYEQRVAVKDLLRNWTLAFLGNVVGCVIMGYVANYTKILAGGAGDMVVAAAVRKCSQGFGELLVKGVMCNWLLCLAVWLCTMAKGLGGKLIGASDVTCRAKWHAEVRGGLSPCLWPLVLSIRSPTCSSCPLR